MKTRPLGRSGLQVSAVGLGTWQLGAHKEWNGPSEEESVRIVRRALELGCTFIDTAPPYAQGRSEEHIGRALEGRRNQAIVCTKFGFHPPDFACDYSADRIEESVESSLRRLRTDYLDVLLIHGPLPEHMDGLHVRHYDVMQRLVDAGMLRA